MARTRPGRRGDTVMVAEDEYPRRDTTMESLAKLCIGGGQGIAMIVERDL